AEHDDEFPEGVNGKSSEGAESGAEVPESAAESAPEEVPESVPEEGGLTVEDILAAEQTEEASGADGEGGAEADAEDAAQSDPYLEDLRRLSAEYANYRKRTEANAELERQRAKAAAVSALLPVVDDLDRAEEHGDLAEG